MPLSIKMEADLRERFMAVAAGRQRPAAQIIRDLLRLSIAENEAPNALAADTLRRSRRSEEVHRAKDAADLFERLGN